MIQSSTTQNSSSSTSQNKTVADTPGTQSAMGQAVAGAAGGAAALFSFWNLSSPQGLWITMNQFQLILLLLLTKSNIPNSIVSYLSGLKATTCSFNFIPFKNIPGLNKLVDILDFSLPNKNLDYFGIFSGSTFANNFSLICFLMIFIVIHSVFLVINKNIQHRTNWNMCSKWMKISYQFFTFTFYIRIFLEASQFLMLSSFSEIYQFNVSSLSNIISILFAIIGSMLWLWLVWISFIGWLKQKDVEDMDKYFPLKEFFNGIKNGKVAKLYSMLLLWRRFVFVALLIFGGSLSNIALICPMIIVQIAYLTNLIIVRPYKQVKNNVIEIVNEWFYFLLVTLLSYFNTSERWSKTIETVYFWIILTNSFIIILIMISKYLYFNIVVIILKSLNVFYHQEVNKKT